MQDSNKRANLKHFTSLNSTSNHLQFQGGYGGNQGGYDQGSNYNQAGGYGNEVNPARI